MAIAIGLLKMLLELHETRKTGALGVAKAEACVRVFIEEGQVVFADEGPDARTAPRGELQVKQRIVRALGWASARLRFVESEGPIEVVERFAVSIEPLAVAALRLTDRNDIDQLLSQGQARYAALHRDREESGGATKGETTKRLEALKLAATEHAFAQTLDGSRTIAELIAGTNEGPSARGAVDRGVVIAALLLTEALDLHRSAAAADMSVETVPNEPLIAPLLADRAFKAGKELAREHRLVEALVELRRAAALYPAIEHDLWVAWAEARSDRRGEESHRETLSRLAEAATAQEAEQGFATYVLGHLARRAGEHARAEALFERARMIDSEIGAMDHWNVRLRLDPPARRDERTRSDVVALAPLMTTPPPPVVEYRIGDSDSDSDSDNDSDSDSDSDSDNDSDNEENLCDEEMDGRGFASASAMALAPAAERGDVEDDTSNAGLPSSSSSRNVMVAAAVAAISIFVAILVLTRSGRISTTTTEFSSAGAAASAPSLDRPGQASVGQPSEASSVGTVTALTPSTVDASYAPTDAGLPSRSRPR